jgi:DNA-binding transcriptional MerR regulator/DNA-directed RNA polymerase subunit RPC12/RpoP
MSKYTTGEIAKRCGVSVRTVQYYDSRGILIPSELSEGGRRLYSDTDLQRMKIICFLREIGLPINSIGKLLSEKEPANVISLLLEQQEQELCADLEKQQKKLEQLRQLKRALKAVSDFSVESIGDIAHTMENKKKLQKVHQKMIAIGIPMDLIEIFTIVFWIKTGIWWPFAIGICLVAIGGIWVFRYYLKRVSYICPQCHSIFQASAKAVFFASHTPKTRKLTCPSCGHKGFCVETIAEDTTV